MDRVAKLLMNILLVFILVATQVILVRLENPTAKWIWCDLAKVCLPKGDVE